MYRMFSALIALLLISLPSWVQAGILHEERSLYRNIIVSEADGQRCMRFVLHDKVNHNQSCVFLNDGKKLVFDYTKMVLASLLIKPEPKNILVVGLGGGTLPMVFHQLLPSAQITSVEIDPAVVKAAQRFFAYQENPQVITELLDARVFIKRAGRQGKKWDLVVLDAFNGDYIPEHLMTREFLQEVQAVLNPGGLVAANTFADSRLYHHETATYNAVFSHIHMLSFRRGNRVLFAANDAFSLPA
ncbi:MAG TPA: fused MFS/spermidine synthase, partial [Cellvibrionaceae bacterium]|nr:fused MFS/spermidine synthase [Cellvibrionaceae bacterium]